APWLDEGLAPGVSSSRLYRLLEFVTAVPPAAGWAAGGRLPGKVNINTIWDPETLLALCDPQPANRFRVEDVAAVYARMISLRTPGEPPGPADRPFRSLAVGAYPPGGSPARTSGGIDETFLRLQPPSGGVHPYFDAEL